MTIKEHIIGWLGFRAELISQEARLTEINEAHAAGIKAQKKEFEDRIGLVLEASMTAADKIARAVAERGDTNLKEYIDSCFDAVQQATQWN